MKPALVLGLALAANAMAADQGDNELIVASHGRYEHDIAQRLHGKIMYDEVADDELAVRQKVIHGFPESFAAADDELAYKLVIPRPHVPVTEPAAFDDHEFARKGDTNRDKEVVSRLGYVNPASFFDEVADDELAYKLVIPRPHVPVTEPAAFDDHEFARKSKGDSNRDKEVVSRLGYVNPASFFDEVADDELAVKPNTMRPAVVTLVTLPSGEKVWVKKENTPEYTKKMYDKFFPAADDELAYKLVIPRPHVPITEPVTFDDHEFARKSKGDSNRDKEVVSRLGYVNPASFFDEVADDELLVSPPRDMTRYGFDESGRVLRDNIGRPVKPVLHRFDEVADDEFAVRPLPLDVKTPLVRNAAVRPITLPSGEKTWVALDDDEFAFFPRAPRVFFDRNLVKKNQTSEAGHSHNHNHKKLKPAKNTTLEALDRDDEADNELAYLGQLIRDGGFIPRLYADDELRAEKPSHVKAEERAQFKSDLPKKQRKLRPHPDVIPMTEN